MLINVVRLNAEKSLLDWILQGSNGHWGVLHFACAALPNPPDEASLLLALKPLLDDRSACIYCMADGDIVVAFNGPQKAIKDELSQILCTLFNCPNDPTLHHYYDAQAQAEELRDFCKKRLPQAEKTAAPVLSKSTQLPQSLEMSQLHKEQFDEANYTRSYRLRPEILIVEDQPFTQALLHSVLGQQFKVYLAGDAYAAWNLYFEHAPDIVFLDIEMPGINGHELAAALHRHDPQAFIVMVTGNNYAEDVNRARKNDAKGFIVKPFSKKKIFESIEKFTQQKKTAR